MAAFVEAAAKCDPEIVRPYSFDPRRAMAALQQRALTSDASLEASSEASTSRQDPGLRLSLASSIALQQSEQRMNDFRESLDAARRQAEEEAAVAKASIRSTAHTHNAFAVVTGAKLQLPTVPLNVATHHDLVDRSVQSSEGDSVLRPGQPRKHSSRSQAVDALQAEYRKRVVQSCEEELRSHPLYRPPLPPMPVVVINEDGDAWRRGQ
jgi:hypothetical protein